MYGMYMVVIRVDRCLAPWERGMLGWYRKICGKKLDLLLIYFL